MPWVIVYVALAFGTLLVLGVFGYRLWTEVRHLSRVVRSSSQRLTAAALELDALTRSPARYGGGEGPR